MSSKSSRRWSKQVKRIEKTQTPTKKHISDQKSFLRKLSKVILAGGVKNVFTMKYFLRLFMGLAFGMPQHTAKAPDPSKPMDAKVDEVVNPALMQSWQPRPQTSLFSSAGCFHIWSISHGIRFLQSFIFRRYRHLKQLSSSLQDFTC